jgi:hypothetical protein
MKILLSLALAALLACPSSLSAQNALLWKVEGNGAKPSYLFGTMHLIPEDSFFLPEGLEQALKKSKRLVLELPLDGGGASGMIAALSAMFLPPSQPLKSLYDTADYERIERFLLDSLPTPPAMYQRTKPIFLSQQLSAYCLSGPSESYELYLSKAFRAAKKPVEGLETMQQQMKLLDAVPLEEQAEMLLDMVADPQQMCRQLDTLYALYRRQDLGGILVYSNSANEFGDYSGELLGKRNAAWIEPIERMLRAEPVLVAVGAAHLPGPEGVIELLRSRGFRVSPVLSQ